MTHSDFIEALGGGTKVAERLKIDREAVYKWRERDLIPWRWRPHLISFAREKGIRPPKQFLPGVAA